MPNAGRKVSDSKATPTTTTTDFEDDGGSFGNMGRIPPPNRGDNEAQRRSQRVILKVTVVVLAQGSDNKLLSEVTRTVTVNAHGAQVLLGLKVSIGRKCRVEWCISALINQRSEKWELNL